MIGEQKEIIPTAALQGVSAAATRKQRVEWEVKKSAGLLRVQGAREPGFCPCHSIYGCFQGTWRAGNGAVGVLNPPKHHVAGRAAASSTAHRKAEAAVFPSVSPTNPVDVLRGSAGHFVQQEQLHHGPACSHQWLQLLHEQEQIRVNGQIPSLTMTELAESSTPNYLLLSS